MTFRGTAYYLAGDSYPADRATEQFLCDRLRPNLPRILTQGEWLGAAGNIDAATRLDRLDSCIGDAEDAVLIGRSRGAMVASLLAARRKARAVVCIAYPFQAPSKILEAERSAHLATATVPTLILQGAEDEYGGAEVTERYRFSPAVHLHLLPGIDHDYRLSRAGWDMVVPIILAFINADNHQPAPDATGFDEGDYLRRHPDVAAAIAGGRVRSGLAHYLRHGRSEGRRFRLRPLAGPFAGPASVAAE